MAHVRVALTCHVAGLRKGSQPSESRHGTEDSESFRNFWRCKCSHIYSCGFALVQALSKFKCQSNGPPKTATEMSFLKDLGISWHSCI